MSRLVFESYTVYKLVLKIVENSGVKRKTLYFDSFADAREFGFQYKEEHEGVQIQQIKEQIVYKKVDK